ncbi:MAG TPA: peptidase T [Gaiellaceae bacterium]|nr:peptidase T [Gaiellaceae bacterium]
MTDEVLERFLRYVRIDTQADPASTTVPSTEKQLDLSRLLVRELLELGLADAELDEHGYVLATVPETVDRAVPTIALLAHVDVAPDAPAAHVEPQVVRYEGGRLPLPGNPDVALDPEQSPQLRRCVGHRLVTSDGTTLLGADNKAGVAEIMTAAARLVAHPEIPHGPVRICFTRDEEVGRGVELLDLDRLGADAAYTIDGSDAGSIEAETFSALEATVTFTGVAVHPGYAKGRMVNALKVAADFLAALPRDRLSPETTAGREGFVNPMSMTGQEGEATISLNLRDFDDALLAEHEQLIRRLADDAIAAHPGSSVRVDVVQPYRNMQEYLAGHPEVTDAAAEAVRRAGLEPKPTFIRGGTDGARLSQLGVPTPNLFSGQQDIHALNEWVSVADLDAAVATIVHLAQVWAEEPTARA